MIELSSGGSPATAWRLGDETAIRAGALEPGASYHLRVARRFRGTGYASSTALVAGPDGTIDTAGDPDRPFWSMRPIADAVEEGFVTFSLTQGDEVIASARLAIAAPQGIDVADGIVGRLFVSAAPSGAAVIVLGGSGGGIDSAVDYAAALAARGFTALALAYFGMPGLPDRLDGITLEYVERAIAWLHADSRVRADKVAIVGRSRGGELALLVAARIGGVAAIVGHAASTFAWAGMSGGPAWLHGGVQLPYLVAATSHVEITAVDGHPVLAPGAAFREALRRATAAELAAARIAIDTPTLLLCGEDDAMWPSAWFAADASPRSRAVEVHVFPLAGHRATVLPGDPTTDVALPHFEGPWLRHGGTPEADAHAQRAGWELAIAFLQRQLR